MIDTYHLDIEDLQRIRIYMDISRTEIASAAGISLSYYNKIERGAARPSDYIYRRIRMGLYYIIKQREEEQNEEGN